MGRYMEAALTEQKNIGINLDSKQLLAGVQDAFNNKSKLSDAEIELTLAAFEDQVTYSCNGENGKRSRRE
ncbi:FKBP-type peptidyl-prolyl cis-trans isomerase [Proteus mirabilis]|uniref:FKBP-type peptidyl-prolyl cis-trans isomerase n=1 Tax=Proteus mirabilis TaxID=584 RepID=A0A379GD11_PROMI|nr:FKBP-type peptidyl-prolyl cis-trans isomerase [Proteus mirabilis]